MGDQITEKISNGLLFIDQPEIERAVIASGDREDLLVSLLSYIFRLNCLYMIAKAGSGHIGSSFSSMEIFTYLKIFEKTSPNESIVFSSKGHDAPAIYSVMLGLGELNFSLIHQLRRAGGLPGHPDIGTANIITNTGSLGMGISKAKGMIFANRFHHRERKVFVITGDGELQEGQIWESLASAVEDQMSELIVIVDHNKLQSDTYVSDVSDLGDLERKFSSFGWRVFRCDGNDVEALRSTVEQASIKEKKPSVIIADTIKGKGVSFMEHTSMDSDVNLYKFHSGAPAQALYVNAVNELLVKIQSLASQVGMEPIKCSNPIEQENEAPSIPLTKLIPAYSEALLGAARRNDNIVALDADLVLDTGLIPFRNEFPNRFIECGIAEQDMVSERGAWRVSDCFRSCTPSLVFSRRELMSRFTITQLKKARSFM